MELLLGTFVLNVSKNTLNGPHLREKVHTSHPKIKGDNEMKYEKQKPIGDYWLELGTRRLDVILHHKDGSTWSDPARAMSHLMIKILNKDKPYA